jgi:hypothetical protein
MSKDNPFTRHPDEVNMTYSQHLAFALMLARKTFAASLASVCHAVFPFLFTTYTSRTIFILNRILIKRLLNKKNHA